MSVGTPHNVLAPIVLPFCPTGCHSNPIILPLAELEWFLEIVPFICERQKPDLRRNHARLEPERYKRPFNAPLIIASA